MTTNYEPSPESLVPLIGAFSTVEEVEFAGYTFEHDTVPSLGDVVVGYSRGKYRQGVVTHVTKTNTVTITYITEGGLKDGEKIHAQYQASDPERRYRERKAHDVMKREEYQRVVAGEQAPLGRLTVADYTGFLAKMTDEAIEEAAVRERDRVADNKAKSVLDFVNVTSKALKAKDGRVAVAVKR